MKGRFVGFVGVVAIGCALMASAARGEGLTVVRDGQAQVSVVIPADATSAER